MTFTKGNTVGLSTRFGDHWLGVRCGAKTRTGSKCRRPAYKLNSRCPLHGGASTGPRTKDGLARLTEARTTHGHYTAAKRAEAKQSAQVGRQVRAELRDIEQWALDDGHLSKDWRKDWDKL